MSHIIRDPAELCGLGRVRNPAVMRLLRAAGAEEDVWEGRASAYDRFSALAAALPKCAGHPLRDRLQARLAEVTGLTVPLCPHTARAYWNAWVDVHWYGYPTARAAQDEGACPFCRPCAPKVLATADVAVLPDPTAAGADDLPAWERRLRKAVPANAAYVMLTLPPDYAFVRPDPYHVTLALRGEGSDSQALLLAQAARVLGERLRGTPARLLLRGGTADGVVSLLAYLAAAERLPAAVWLPDHPADAAAVSGLYAEVGTGYVLPPAATERERQAMEAAYAAAAPLGGATIWTP